MPSPPPNRLKIIIIGGGIAGLTASIALSLSGQHVTVLEQKAKYLDPTGGNGVRQDLNQNANARKCLFALGLEKAFNGIVDEGREVLVKRYGDGKVISRIGKEERFSMVHRTDLLRILFERAVEVGVEVLTEETFEGIEEGVEGVQVRFRDGRVIEGDLVVGADGINSKVRKHIPSTKDIRPKLTGDCVFLVDVPKTVMDKHPSTSHLYAEGQPPHHFYIAPERCIVSWTMTSRQLYHLQIADNQYHDGKAYGLSETPDASFVSRFTNMAAFRERWKDHGEAIRRVLEETEVCTRWRIAETPDEMAWWSEGRRIMLIGDAAHAFEPYVGQGAAMAIEDATVLARLIARVSKDSSLELRDVADAYEEIRRPRISGIRQMIKENVKIFFMKDGEEQAERDRLMGKEGFSAVDETESENGEGKVGGNPVPPKKWSTAERYAWIEDYDAIKEAEAYQFPSGSKM